MTILPAETFEWLWVSQQNTTNQSAIETAVRDATYTLGLTALLSCYFTIELFKHIVFIYLFFLKNLKKLQV